jgi:RecB family endonuclease NucS
VTISPIAIEAIADLRGYFGRLVEFPGQKQTSVRGILKLSEIEQEMQRLAAGEVEVVPTGEEQ